MTDSAIIALARAAGLATDWTDQDGTPHETSVDVLRAVLDALGLPAGNDAQSRDSGAEVMRRKSVAAAPLLTAETGMPVRLPDRTKPWRIMLEDGGSLEGKAGTTPHPAELQPGYHRLESGAWSGTLAVAPRRCWTLADAGSGGRLAGLAVQLYALRRRGDPGSGDFAALAELARRAAHHGIDALAISPVHALVTADPARAAPYAPSSRLALSPAYIPCAAPPAAGDPAGDLIDWPDVLARRLTVLRADFERDAAGAAFATFRRRAAPELRRHALFEAIAAAEAATGGGTDWRRWPAALSGPEAPGARRFARTAAREVAFHLYLQYRAESALAAAQQAARQGGMRIGLVSDLAVGVDPGGSDAWMRPDDMLRGLVIGAPPDDFNRAGQNWGLTTFSPFGLRQTGHAGWIRMLRTALGHAGGVRIDHAMGLARLWVIPDGAAATDGVYLEYPFRDLLRLLRLESLRARAVILAEDLGTVPPGFSERLAECGLAGLRVLWFERADGGFRPPESWTPTAAAMTSTHDLPPVAGWWRGHDIGWRARLGLPHESRAARARDRQRLWRAFCAAGAARSSAPGVAEGARVATAAAGFVGRTACQLALLPVEDALALEDQPNLPGTVTEHPNWRRRLPEPVETMLDRADVTARLRALRAGRGGP